MKVEMGWVTPSNTERYSISILKIYSEEFEIFYYLRGSTGGFKSVYFKKQNPYSHHKRKKKNPPPNIQAKHVLHYFNLLIITIFTFLSLVIKLNLLRQTDKMT